MNKYFHFISAAEAREEEKRIEALQESRRAARRLANEMTLIRAAAAQSEREKKAALIREQFERQAWAETLTMIQLMQIEFDR